MFFITILTAAVAAVSASPVELPAKTAVLSLKRVSNVTSIKNVVSKGHARIEKVNGVAAISATTSSGSVTNEDVSYVAPVSIGGHTWQLIVDTGCTSPLQNVPEILY